MVVTKTSTFVYRTLNLPTRFVLMAGVIVVAALVSAGTSLADATDRNDREAANSSNAAPASFRDCGGCPEMIKVPAGSFIMGSPESEPGNSADELPQRRVEIGRPFAVGKFEVTFDEWNACVAGGGCTTLNAKASSGRHPAVGMSWHEAQKYVAWLSHRSSKTYRLLSEAEWEYMARAGTTTTFHTGMSIGPNLANLSQKNNAAASKGVSGFGMRIKVKVKVKGTVPVGSYLPNGFGIHDVHGNVWEWVRDCVNDGYVGAPKDGRAWMTGKCHRRIIRGGSWVDYAEGTRSAIRSGHGSAGQGRTLGLRISRTLY